MSHNLLSVHFKITFLGKNSSFSENEGSKKKKRQKALNDKRLLTKLKYTLSLKFEL